MDFKWAWWLEEDEMKRYMAEEMRETSEILSILDL
jgi:predicted DNA-binding protein with PD1-like motif